MCTCTQTLHERDRQSGSTRGGVSPAFDASGAEVLPPYSLAEIEAVCKDMPLDFRHPNMEDWRTRLADAMGEQVHTFNRLSSGRQRKANRCGGQRVR